MSTPVVLPRRSAAADVQAELQAQIESGQYKESERLPSEADLARATHLRERAKGLYRRALGYGMRGLEVDHPGLRKSLDADDRAALAGAPKSRVAWSKSGPPRVARGPRRRGSPSADRLTISSI